MEAALLDAAWAELSEAGYGAMTFDGVARRAGTSRSVVYRRWATKHELVLAAVQRYFESTPVEIPNTGSLRGDTVALLEDFSLKRSDVIAAFTIRLGAYFEETGTSLAELRDALVNSFGRGSVMVPILARAAGRGEVDLTTITPRVAHLPVDLLRNELLVSGPPSRETIESIVDDVFLPLVTRRT